MNNRTVVLSVLMMVGMLSICVFVWAAEPQCQKPSASTKACYDPDDAVASCDGLYYFECEITRDVKVYEIQQFPDGTINANSGATKTESSNCWRGHGCGWDYQLEKCVDATGWFSWHVKQKIVANPNVICPEE